MDEALNELKKRYRQIEAPPHILTRIRANTAGQPAGHRGWLPVAATAVLTAAMLGLIPVLWQSSSLPETPDARPSLAKLASLSVERPDVRRPSLSKLRTLPTPRMPEKPALRKPADVDDSNRTHLEIAKENDHAHS